MVLSAEFTMLVRCGVGTAASKFQGIAVKPDCVSEMIAFRLKSGARVRVNGLTPVLVLDVAVAACAQTAWRAAETGRIDGLA